MKSYSPDGKTTGSIVAGQDADCDHPRDQIYEVGECRDGCCTDYRCKKCDRVFRFEWPA